MNDGTGRIVIAAYRLPYKQVKTRAGYKAVPNSGGLVSAIISLSEKFGQEKINARSEILWAGVSTRNGSELLNLDQKEIPFETFPVLLDPDVNDDYYGGFCNDLIWPLFHYFPSFAVFKPSYFNAYREANEVFYKALATIIRPGDFIWIQDYQLMLLPGMIRKVIPDATVGFFLHIPFPSFELFRMLPRAWREALIHGILGADVIGFHTNDYTQNFIKSVRRITGYECHQNLIHTPERTVRADAFPIGIDYVKFRNACTHPSVVKVKNSIKAQLGDQKLVFSVDRLDYSKGLLYRLKGIEAFLEKYPGWREKVVFNMVIVPSRDNIGRYKEIKTELEYTVGRINGKYSTLSWRPVIYQYKSLSFNELVTLYDLSDVGLITPLRDGMNLVAKEYVACQVENQGVLILSEMTGAAAELNEAIIINPFDSDEMAEGIRTALEMNEEERIFRLKKMQQRISSYDVFAWAFDFFTKTKEVKKLQEGLEVKLIGHNLRSKIIGDYAKGKNRYLFLDYDGTLVSFARYPESAVIDKATAELIRTLSRDRRNHLVIISGRDKTFLEEQFGDLEVSLVAEHGCFIKKFGTEWVSVVQTGQEWKQVVRPLLEEYVNRCQGSILEEKSACIAWHYRNVDSDYAQVRVNELRDDLAELIRTKTSFEVSEGHKVLEIKSGRFDKGQATMKFIEEGNPDFILAAGDDKTDESIFQSLPSFAYTIKVGTGPSSAKYYVSNYSDLVLLLKALT